jgi:hypothetical protein
MSDKVCHTSPADTRCLRAPMGASRAGHYDVLPFTFDQETFMTPAFIPIWILGAGFIGLMLLSAVFARGHVISGGYVTGLEPFDVPSGSQPISRSRSI